jgi:hypothetical protein
MFMVETSVSTIFFWGALDLGQSGSLNFQGRLVFRKPPYIAGPQYI